MVKKKSGRTLNPADAHRKALRQKEIKKNKAERKRVRTLVMVHKDTTKLEEEVARYKGLDREKKLDKNGKSKLKELQDKLSKIIETKKAHGISLKKDVKTSSTPKPQVPIYFHPTLNPSGLPPQDQVSIGENAEDEDISEASGDEDEEESLSGQSDVSGEEDQNDTDEDIPLPPGLPSTNDSSSDELPELPPGPHPTRKVESDDEKQTSSDDEQDYGDLPELPPGPPPSNAQPNNGSYLTMRPLSPPFAYGVPGTPPGPPFGNNLQFSNPFITYGPGNAKIIRANIRPPPPPFLGGPSPNTFPLRPPPPPLSHSPPITNYLPRPQLSPSPISRPQPLNPQFSHYGPSPIQGQNGVMPNESRIFSQTSGVLPPSSPKSTVSVAATPVIEAAPQVRNLQKELTTLVPTALLRKKAAAARPRVTRPIVNAAPNIDDASDSISPLKRTASTALSMLQEHSVTQEELQESNQSSSAAPPPLKKAKAKKKYDEYEKFMSEMQDLL